MSNYTKPLINPKTGKRQIAGMIDDYFGSHYYAVMFNKDGSPYEIINNNKKCDIYREDEYKNILKK